jgi:hypothetical protein
MKAYSAVVKERLSVITFVAYERRPPRCSTSDLVMPLCKRATVIAILILTILLSERRASIVIVLITMPRTLTTVPLSSFFLLCRTPSAVVRPSYAP